MKKKPRKKYKSIAQNWMRKYNNLVSQYRDLHENVDELLKDRMVLRHELEITKQKLGGAERRAVNNEEKATRIARAYSAQNEREFTMQMSKSKPN